MASRRTFTREFKVEFATITNGRSGQSPRIPVQVQPRIAGWDGAAISLPVGGWGGGGVP